MREASARNGMGREFARRSHQWNLPAAHLVSPVSKVPALLSAEHGFVQGKISRWTRECLEASLASNEDYVNKLEMSRGIISEKRIKIPSSQGEKSDEC